MTLKEKQFFITFHTVEMHLSLVETKGVCHLVTAQAEEMYKIPVKQEAQIFCEVITNSERKRH